MEEELPILTVVFASGLETRKIVERAKGVMQRDLKISEEEAYPTLQRESRQRRESMREVAEAILLNGEIRHPAPSPCDFSLSSRGDLPSCLHEGK